VRSHFTGAYFHWLLGLQEAWSAVAQVLGAEVPSTLPCLTLYRGQSVMKVLYRGVYRPHREQLEAEYRAREAAMRARQLAAQQAAAAAAAATEGQQSDQQQPSGSSQMAGGAGGSSGQLLAKHSSPGPRQQQAAQESAQHLLANASMLRSAAAGSSPTQRAPLSRSPAAAGAAANPAAAATAAKVAALRATVEAVLRGWTPGQPLQIPQVETVLAAVAQGVALPQQVAAAAMATLFAAQKEGRAVRHTPEAVSLLVQMAGVGGSRGVGAGEPARSGSPRKG